jgi:hypothetical protein
MVAGMLEEIGFKLILDASLFLPGGVYQQRARQHLMVSLWAAVVPTDRYT